MKTIWKYVLPDRIEIGTPFPIEMNKGEILTCKLQGERFCVWVIVDSTEEPKNRYFMVCFTGDPFPDHGYNYISTIQLRSLVYHVFEIVKEKNEFHLAT